MKIVSTRVYNEWLIRKEISDFDLRKIHQELLEDDDPAIKNRNLLKKAVELKYNGERYKALCDWMQTNINRNTRTFWYSTASVLGAVIVSTITGLIIRVGIGG